MLSFATQQAFTIGTTLMARLFPVDFLRKKLMWVWYCTLSCPPQPLLVLFVIFLHIQDVANWESKVPAFDIPL